jgi:hypothetical protein
MGGEREAPAPARGVTITRQVAGGAHRESHRVTIASAAASGDSERRLTISPA